MILNYLKNSYLISCEIKRIGVMFNILMGVNNLIYVMMSVVLIDVI